MEMQPDRDEIDMVINELEKREIDINKYEVLSSLGDAGEEQMRGVGDVVEDVLTKFGITQERFKSWFNLHECNCTKRKAWLNKFFSWKVKKNE